MAAVAPPSSTPSTAALRASAGSFTTTSGTSVGGDKSIGTDGDRAKGANDDRPRAAAASTAFLVKTEVRTSTALCAQSAVAAATTTATADRCAQFSEDDLARCVDAATPEVVLTR